ncbi:alpha/beta-hydrolase [Rickenella mellea]|uniref:Alpha/beta-hydrolase n=1 Tax=Rickenella mellea TaxID=50990 RepID=A0A4Y7QJ53_9AGAM|nr:alpha/beta-hydrolase [Rickenella mellea]
MIIERYTIALALSNFIAMLGATASSLENGISQSLFDDFVRYTKYSSAAYQLFCPRPLGQKLVLQFNDIITDTQGFIARDDTRKELVVAVRGSSDPVDFLTDVMMILAPYTSPGVPPPPPPTDDIRTHLGFLTAYNAVAPLILKALKTQHELYPDYTLISTGHSLGGAIASLGGVSMKCNFPEANVRLFTFGQPRTGNAAYAAFVETTLGVRNVHRAVHTFDGVPTIIPQYLGYQHHPTEYWNFVDPASPSSVKRCTGGEDPEGSGPHPSTGINIAHTIYFGQVMAVDPSLCF